MASMDDVISHIMAREGGYVDAPADHGGATKYGITQAVARAHGYTGPMRDMPASTARAIYARSYIQQPGFDRVETLAPGVGAELADTGVNMGTVIASEFLQRALNVLAPASALKIDGHIGPATLTALGAYMAQHAEHGAHVLIVALNCLQGARYIAIAEGDASQKVFIYGWLINRVAMK